MVAIAFGDRVYKFLKFVAQIVLPAFATLYYALSQIWGLPNADKVSGTVLVVAAFIGTLLGISSSNYTRSDKRFDGHIDVEQSEDKKLFSLNLNDDPEKLEGKSSVTFKVNNPTTEVDIKTKRKPRKRVG